jgi:hypothetical protein
MAGMSTSTPTLLKLCYGTVFHAGGYVALLTGCLVPLGNLHSNCGGIEGLVPWQPHENANMEKTLMPTSIYRITRCKQHWDEELARTPLDDNDSLLIQAVILSLLHNVPAIYLHASQSVC